MQSRTFRYAWLLPLALLPASFTACSNNKDSPDEIRQRAADATATMRRDTRAVVEGVKEGMNRDKTISINRG